MTCDQHLIARNLKKQYQNKVAVRDISLSVTSGQVVGLLGPNGAGKTTCFYMIAGLVRADHGNISLHGKDISRLPMHARAKAGLGYLPQEASIFRKLSVSENILAVLEAVTDLPKSARLDKTDLLLKEFNLEHVRNSIGLSLSGGERRRVEIARALATEPKFVLLDEPFAGVDPISVNDIKTIIKYLAEQNIGILITDHNVRETLDICSRAFIVNDGIIIAEGTSQEVLENNLVKSVYLGENFKL
ncbi:MAG: LPS export ABC transporter ATP-binding protein [Gammaproteobacteria bacterium]|nr:LPS export ABC transporter ATP-binding protein [Gammaproteobacteria bacterium]MBT5600631.1 LPS export ABC transporter ATP-binding protein [Gammaproteobacteria bacterium]MBT6244576.1 LPS export ABC transporter ATP-binding protein [Gammaproteobacteria bacterium]